jgi:hypothetical protein
MPAKTMLIAKWYPAASTIDNLCHTCRFLKETSILQA